MAGIITMMTIAIAVFSSFLLSVCFVALMLYIARKKSWYDTIDERKIHTGDVPRLGGVGFAGAFIIVVFVISFISPEDHFGWRFLPVVLAMLLILLCGIYDDLRPLAPRIKMGLQIIAGLCVIFPGYTFSRFIFPDIPLLSSMKWFWYPLSLLWLVGLTNAVNFIDGVDGLAGGVSALAALSYAAVFASFPGSKTATLLCICLAAVIGGFLVFNLPIPKAKIFMGDGGAYFLGFILALLPFINKTNAQPDFPLLHAAALLQLPIFDTFAAIWRRLRDGRRIDSPDKLHIHHKLLNIGLKDRGVLALAYGLQIIIGALVFFSVKIQGLLSLVPLGAAYLTGISCFTVIHYMNLAALKRASLKSGGTPLL